MSLIKKIEDTQVRVIQFQGSKELLNWLSIHGRRDNSASQQQISIISNGYRENDGGESAGIRLCQFLKQDGSEWKDIPFLLFCSNKNLVHDPKFPVFTITDKSQDVLKFATSDIHFMSALKQELKPKFSKKKFESENIWMTPSELVFHRHRRREHDKNISVSFKGSSWQIAEYKTKTGEIWIVKIPGQPLTEIIYEAVGALVYSKCGIHVASVKITQVPIIVDTITKFVPIDSQYAIASKKIDNFTLLGENFMDQLLNKERKIPVKICEQENYANFWELLAVAHWIGDSDCLGTSGKNAGFIIVDDEREYALQNKKKYHFVKIDTGFFLAAKDLLLTKDIFVSPRDILFFDSIQTLEKQLFINQVIKITSLSDDEIIQMTQFKFTETTSATTTTTSTTTTTTTSTTTTTTSKTTNFTEKGASTTRLPLLPQFDFEVLCKSIAEELIARRNMMQQVYSSEITQVQKVQS